MMTPQQALDNLYGAAQEIQAVAAVHKILADSAKVLADFIEKNTDKPAGD